MGAREIDHHRAGNCAEHGGKQASGASQQQVLVAERKVGIRSWRANLRAAIVSVPPPESVGPVLGLDRYVQREFLGSIRIRHEHPAETDLGAAEGDPVHHPVGGNIGVQIEIGGLFTRPASTQPV